MSGQGSSYISLAMYRYLCQKIVGTEETVKTKRIMNTANDDLNGHPNYVCITSGSFGEGLEMRGSDLDFIYVMKGCDIYEDTTDVHLRYNSTCFQAMTDDVKPGFVKLLLLHNKKNSAFTGLFERIGGDLFLSNTLWKIAFANRMGVRQMIGSEFIHGPCISDKDENVDLAGCLRSRNWTNQANRWITRPNQSWPSHELKGRIIEYGVLFVPIGVKGSPKEDIEWRISFSVAEKLLMASFTHTQLLCYAMMKILMKDVINKDKRVEDLLCSYFLKNILFWMSEELPVAIWKPESLISCFLRCLKRLIYCVTYSSCIHYFITENDMFENRIKGEKQKILLSNLNALQSLNWRCLLLSPQLSDFRPQTNTTLITDEQLFIDHTEQMGRSFCLEDFPPLMSGRLVVYKIRSYRSRKIKFIYLRQYSKLCGFTAQILPIISTNRNKILYQQYKNCQYHLAQSTYHDSIFSWLYLASLFYKMKQYNKALDILSYSLTKCRQDKLFVASAVAHTRHELWKLKSVQRLGVFRLFKTFGVADVCFWPNASLIPQELDLEVAVTAHFLPPIVYAYFLCFLCHYPLGDVPNYIESLYNLNETILKRYYIRNIHAKAAAYSCLGVAYQMTGEMIRAKKAFTSARVISTLFNCATQRLEFIGTT